MKAGGLAEPCFPPAPHHPPIPAPQASPALPSFRLAGVLIKHKRGSPKHCPPTLDARERHPSLRGGQVTPAAATSRGFWDLS